MGLRPSCPNEDKAMINQYIAYLRYTKGFADNTCKAYYQALRSFACTMRSKEKRWSTISETDIRQYLASELTTKKPATIILYIAAIRGIFNWLQKEASLPNPATYIQAPKKESLIPHVISLQDIKSAISKEPVHSIRLAIVLMSFAGLRVSEVRNLRYEDISKDGRVLIHGKGNKERYVYITKNIQDMIGKGTGAIYNIDDRPFRKAIWSAFYRIGVQCSPHMLRHSFAASSLDNGIRLDVLAEILGHSSIKTTQIYLHTKQSVVKEQLISFQNV